MGKSKDLASGAAYQDQTESDTRYVNTAGDTMTGDLIVNKSGSSQSLVSVGGGSTNAALSLRGSTGSAHAWQISSNAHVASALEFTKSTGVGNTTFTTPSMVINSSGHVTKPNQPSFSRRGQYGWQTKSSVDNIGSWYDGYDNTNMLNASTGVATAPVAGKYMVNFLMYVNDTSTTAHYARPYVNGSVYKDAICYLSSGNANDNTSSATWFINLSANDTVQWYHLGDIYGYHTWWNMHLLG